MGSPTAEVPPPDPREGKDGVCCGVPQGSCDCGDSLRENDIPHHCHSVEGRYGVGVPSRDFDEFSVGASNGTSRVSFPKLFSSSLMLRTDGMVRDGGES